MYDAYVVTTRRSSVIRSRSDCGHCDSADKSFYKIVVITFAILWIIIYVVISIAICAFRGACYQTKDVQPHIGEVEKKSQKWLRILVSTKLLDYKCRNKIKNDINKYRDHGQLSSTNGDNSANNKVTTTQKCCTAFCCSITFILRVCRFLSHLLIVPLPQLQYGGNNANNEVTTTRECCTAFSCSIMFILRVCRFFFHLLIVPLLQLQLLNEYSWNCLMNSIICNYCEIENTKHYISQGHSLMTYFLYVLLLIALLFAILIQQLPKGSYPSRWI